MHRIGLEAQDYSGQWAKTIVEKVMMTPQVHAWIGAYVDTHHEEEQPLLKRAAADSTKSETGRNRGLRALADL